LTTNLPAEQQSIPPANLRPAIVVITAIVLAGLVILHTRGLNGPWYWQWRWRQIPAGRWYAAMALAAVPSCLAALVWQRRVAAAIVLLMVSTFAMRLASAGVVRGWFDTSLIAEIVKSPEATSYYADAAVLSTYPGWLADYPDLLYNTSLHTQSKPPGPVHFWMTVVRVFGYNDRAAVIGAIVMGLLATLSVPATWWLVTELTARRLAGARVCAVFSDVRSDPSSLHVLPDRDVASRRQA
jgi:hypothetical protein